MTKRIEEAVRLLAEYLVDNDIVEKVIQVKYKNRLYILDIGVSSRSITEKTKQ